MKNLFYLLFIYCFISCCHSHYFLTNVNKINGVSNVDYYDSTFEYHFHILDSAKNAHPLDSLYECCNASIKFMEDKTGISSITSGTFVGKIKFTKSDLRKWQTWYDNHKK